VYEYASSPPGGVLDSEERQPVTQPTSSFVIEVDVLFRMGQRLHSSAVAKLCSERLRWRGGNFVAGALPWPIP
jgi:hypothetical protein